MTPAELLTYCSGRGISLSSDGENLHVEAPKGVMTDRDARKQGVGGEVICEVW